MMLVGIPVALIGIVGTPVVIGWIGAADILFPALCGILLGLVLQRMQR
jgi:hypothetical protein